MNKPAFNSKSQLLLNKMKKFRLFSFIRRKYYWLLLILVFMFVIHYTGVFLYLFQCDLEDYSYPHMVNRPNLTKYVNFYHQRFDNFSNLEQIKKEANQLFEAKTLKKSFDERFIIENQNKCLDKNGRFEEIRLLILIKSALPNRKQRDILRKTWADEKRFSDVKIRTLFSVGSCEEVSSESLAKLDIKQTLKNCQDLVDEENELNNDLIQTDFIDNYYNNTVKTMNGIKWIVKNCPKSQFILLIDDDYYLSVKNLLRHLRWLNFSNEDKKKISDQFKHLKSDYEKSLIKDLEPKFNPFKENLYSGWVFNSSLPCRYRYSKWFINLDEYPFSRFPAYVTAGFVLLTNRSLKSIYFASLYTRIFRFDDIYLSILTRKTGIHPLHNQDVYYYKHPYNDDGLEYTNVIGSHGFKDGNEMMRLFILMKSRGFA